MIQRIQSLYLFVAVLFIILAFFFPVGTVSDGLIKFSLLGCTTFKPIGLLGIASLSVLISVAAIFLFKNRMLQSRFCLVNVFVILGYYLVYIVYFMLTKEGKVEHFIISVGTCFPFVSLVLSLMAYRCIEKDEELVKAANRLR